MTVAEQHFRNFLLLEEYKIIFCYLPKVACTSFKCFFRKILGHKDWLDAARAHAEPPESDIPRLSDLDVSTAREMLADSAWKKIVFVRNPYTRIVSAYINKFMECDSQFLDIYRRVALGIYAKIGEDAVADGDPRQLTLDQFVKYLGMERDDLAMDDHWIPQSTIALPGQISYDFIGRFENLSLDLRSCSAQSGLVFELPSTRDTKFASVEADRRSITMLSDSHRETIRARYASDFELFGYPVE